MMRALYRIFLFQLSFLFVSGFISGGVYAAALQADEVSHTRVGYSFGVVPQFEQRKLFQIWRPILSELERRTGFRFVLKGSSKIPAFEQRFMAGGFDFAYMNPYHLVIASSSQGYIPLIRDGGRSLHGILVVRKDSGIETVAQLAGKTISFPSPNALGASLLMRAELKGTFGIDFEPKYVQTHSSVYLHILKNLVDAGGGVTQTLELQKPSIKNNLKVLFETRGIATHPVAVHPRVPVEHQMRVRNALLDMAAGKRGKDLFRQVPIKQVVAASMSDYESITMWGLEKYYVP